MNCDSCVRVVLISMSKGYCRYCKVKERLVAPNEQACESYKGGGSTVRRYKASSVRTWRGKNSVRTDRKAES